MTTSRTIRDNSGKMIGVVTRPAPGHFWAHSIHDRPKRKFRVRWKAASWIHAIHDNETEG
jgi:hypothetical protein